MPVAGDRIERCGTEIIFDCSGHILGAQLLEVGTVGADFVALEASAVRPHQFVAAANEGIRPEDAGITAQMTKLARQPDGQIVDGF